MTRDKPTRPLLRYYGGKWRLASWIIGHFPEHQLYVEPFAGSAAVLMKKRPSRFEVINDIDSQVINFFKVLRDRPNELATALRFTPYSREEFEKSFEDSSEDPLERARMYFICAWQGFGGPRKTRQSGWKVQKRTWESGRSDQIPEWNNAKDIFAAARRLSRVQIENDHALHVIRRWDTPGTLFYVDPPYPADTRNQRWCKSAYSHELDGQDHYHLANLLNKIKGKAIISTYPNPLYDELFKGWITDKKTAQTMNKTNATEVLYIKP